VPQELEAIIVRCLEKNPERRFRTVADLTQALLPFASREGRNSLMIVRRSSSLPPRTSPSRIAQDPTMMQPAETDRTMVSAGSEPKPRTELIPDETVKRRRKPVVLIAATAVGIVALSFTLLKATAPKAPSTSVAPSAFAEAPAQKGLFHVYIDSSPQGADVIEGDVLLGTTPLDIVVARSSVRDKSRTFLLQKHGYLPFSLAQGDSEENVRLSAALEAAPTAPAPAPTRTAAVTSPPRARAPKPHPSVGTATPAPAPEPDIRMQR
jgi:hypothetical protein